MGTFLRRCSGRWWGVLLVVAIPIFVAFSPVLIGGKAIAEESLWYHVPLYTFYRDAITGGESFLWNPLNFSGFPSFVSVVGFFSPVHYAVFSLLPAVTAYHWLLFLAFALAAFVTGQLLRECGVSFWGACLGGIAYAMTSMTYTNALTMANAVLAAPLLFWIVSRLRRGWGYAAVGTLAVGWGWLSAVPQYFLYALLGASAFVVFLAVRDPAARWRIIGGWGIAVALGTAIGLLQLLPTARFAELSIRAGGLAPQTVRADPALPTDILRYFLPYFEPPLGVPFGSKGAEGFLYLGIVPLFGALLGLGVPHPVARFAKWCFAATAALALIYSPLSWGLSHLPLLNYFRGQSRWLFIGSFALSLLVGFGIDRLRNGERGRMRQALRWFTAVSVAVLLGAVALDLGTRLFPGTLVAVAAAASGKRELAEHVIAATALMASLGRPEAFLALFALAGSLVAIWHIHRNHAQLGAQQAGLMLAAAGAINFLAVAPLTYSRVPRSLLDDPPPTVRFLREHPGRVFGFLTDRYTDEVIARAAAAGRDAPVESALQVATLFPNTNLYFGIEHAGYFDQIRSRQMSRLLNLLGDPYTGRSDFSDVPLDEAAARLATRKPLLDFLGIRYLISGYPLAVDGLTLRSEGELAPSAPIGIYENRDAKPFAYFASALVTLPGGDDAVFHAFAQSGFRGVFAPCDNCTATSRRYGAGSAELVSKSNAALTFRTDSQEPGFLIVSENHLPGWRAWVNGQEASMVTVNTVFMGIPVPGGEQAVALRYTYPCWLTALPACL